MGDAAYFTGFPETLFKYSEYVYNIIEKNRENNNLNLQSFLEIDANRKYYNKCLALSIIMGQRVDEKILMDRFRNFSFNELYDCIKDARIEIYDKIINWMKISSELEFVFEEFPITWSRYLDFPHKISDDFELFEKDLYLPVEIDSIRKRSRLTMEDFSRCMGVSRMTYFSWLNGRKIRKSNLIRVVERSKIIEEKIKSNE